MTDHEGNRENYLARGIQSGLETVDYCPPRAIVNCFQARLNPDSFPCSPRDLSLFSFSISLYAFCDI